MRINLGWWLGLLVGDTLAVGGAAVLLAAEGATPTSAIPAIGMLVFGGIGIVACLVQMLARIRH